MKKIALFSALLTFIFVISAEARPTSDNKSSPVSISEDKWENFNNSLESALKSHHLGLEQGALRMIIQYSDRVDANAVIGDIIRIYRSSEDQHMRRLAVVALSKLDTPRAYRFLEQELRFEKSVPVRKTMMAAIAENMA